MVKSIDGVFSVYRCEFDVASLLALRRSTVICHLMSITPTPLDPISGKCQLRQHSAKITVGQNHAMVQLICGRTDE